MTSSKVPTSDENFCWVFEIPSHFPEKFCFNGGHPVNFQMVDWFNPWPTEWPSGELKPSTWEEVSESLIRFVQQKPYVKPNRRYLVLTRWGATVTVDGPVSQKVVNIR